MDFDTLLKKKKAGHYDPKLIFLKHCWEKTKNFQVFALVLINRYDFGSRLKIFCKKCVIAIFWRYYSFDIVNNRSLKKSLYTFAEINFEFFHAFSIQLKIYLRYIKMCITYSDEINLCSIKYNAKSDDHKIGLVHI